MINVGLVGYGLSGQVFHAPFLHVHPYFQLKKVVERRSEKAKERYPYVEIVRDFSDVLQDETIDLVVITTPNELHYEMVKTALLAGKHVVIEKPFTVTSEEAKKLIDLSKEVNKHILVYQNRRWDGDFLTVRQIIEQQLLGEIVELESHFDRFRPLRKTNAWKEENRPGSGVLYDLGSHLIDQTLVLFGTPETICADLRIQREEAETIDSFALRLDYGRLKVILKASMLVRELGPRFILHGTKGSFIKYGMDMQESMLRDGMWPTDERYGVDKQENWGKINTNIGPLHFEGKIETVRGCYQQFYQHVYETLTEGKEFPVQLEQAYMTIRLIELAVQSAKEQRTVRVQQI